MPGKPLSEFRDGTRTRIEVKRILEFNGFKCCICDKSVENEIRNYYEDSAFQNTETKPAKPKKDLMKQWFYWSWLSPRRGGQQDGSNTHLICSACNEIAESEAFKNGSRVKLGPIRLLQLRQLNPDPELEKKGIKEKEWNLARVEDAIEKYVLNERENSWQHRDFQVENKEILEKIIIDGILKIFTDYKDELRKTSNHMSSVADEIDKLSNILEGLESKHFGDLGERTWKELLSKVKSEVDEKTGTWTIRHDNDVILQMPENVSDEAIKISDPKEE